MFGFVYLLLSLVVMPGLSLLLIISSKDFLLHKKTMKYIGRYYYRFKTDSKECLAFNLIFTLRRVFISIYAIQLHMYPAIQLQLLLLQNMLCMIYIGLTRPFTERKKNRTELANEFIIAIITIILFVYTDFVDNAYTKYDVAWVSVNLFLILIIFNFG